MSLQPSARDWRLAYDDVARSLTSWHIWTLLGLNDIRLRYKRSRFGQFWITLSTAIFIAGIGAVYGGLFHNDIRDYIPYLAVNMTVWSLISGMMSEGTSTFIDASPYMKQDSLPRTSFVLRIVVRNLVAFAHNLVIVPIVFIIFMIQPSPVALLAIPGLALVLLANFLAVLILGILCTRFRDLPQIVANMMQLAFFVTPIMWHIEQLGRRGDYIKVFNPFASFLRIVTEPMLGHVPDPETYGAAVIYLLILVVVAWPLFARFRSRIVYWL